MSAAEPLMITHAVKRSEGSSGGSTIIPHPMAEPRYKDRWSPPSEKGLA